MVIVFLLFFMLISSVVPDLENTRGHCRLDSHPSVEYRCLVADSDGFRACRALEPPGTIVSPRCRKPNYRSTSTLTFMRCFNGDWDYIARCSPECGRVTPDGKGLVVGGQAVKRGELPWHAGIYKKTTSPYKQICGGSLISTNVIISAAHCFWTDIEKQLPAFQFAAAVGKVYKQWNNNLDEAQKSNVKTIHLPQRYQGAGANYQEDIAVVIVAQEFKYMTYVRPVCLSFDYDFEKQQLQAGNAGKVAGWGLTNPNGKPTTLLQVVDLPYVEVGTCIAKSPPNFKEYITGDKICAGTLEPDTALCRGDSGGGLAFSETYRGVERYYLRGVVSTAPQGDSVCNTDTYTAFTSVLKHEHFIKQFWTESGQFKCRDGNFITAANHCDGAKDCPDGSDETAAVCSSKSCSSYLFQCAYGACVDKGATCNRVDECADGSDEAYELCGRPKKKNNGTTLMSSTRCVLPPYPDNGFYEVTNIAGAKPGEVYDLVTINITCSLGYHILGSSSIFCFLGRWQESMPECTNEFRSDYVYYSDADGWFKVHHVPVDWLTAGLICHYEGAELASPRKPEVTGILKELVAKTVPKLQVYFSGVSQTFVGDDKNFLKEIPLEKLQFTWDEDQRSTTGKQCLVYSSDVMEREFNCDDALPYICFRKFSVTDQLTECGTIDKEYEMATTGHCYKFHSRAETWERAQTICRAEGGYLSIINNENEAEILNELVIKSLGVRNDVDGVVAVGFREWGSAGSWWTIHGQTLEEAGFEDWYHGSPSIVQAENNTSQACGGLLNGKLSDISCDGANFPFICEKTTERKGCLDGLGMSRGWMKED